LNAWIGTVFGALYVGLLAFIVRLGAGAPAVPAGAPLAALGSERTWVLLLILAVWAYDTGAYLVGRTYGQRFGELIGRERFLAHISPSKTYAGLAGGLIAATVVVLVGLWAAGQPVVYGLLLGPIVGLAAQCGDLAESMLKRAAGAQNSSELIPGHGGVLDRVDSFLLAAPVMTLFVLTFLR
jgi:phosphatidate cytidylyltransferase